MSKDCVKELIINGIKYIPETEANNKLAEQLDGCPYVICRTYSAGVFAGYMKSKIDKNVTLLQTRRLWYWDGAASLSQLAVNGVSKPQNCKFPCEVDSIQLTEVIEIINVTEKARLSIKAVAIWKI
jgi:hypothetical protein